MSGPGNICRPGLYKSNLYTYGLQPRVTKENNRAEEKLEEEPQEDDSCSQATTARGSTRAVAFGMQYKLWGKNKIKKDKQRHHMCESGDPWQQMIQKNTRQGQRGEILKSSTGY